jgi:hypothetical protein
VQVQLLQSYMGNKYCSVTINNDLIIRNVHAVVRLSSLGLNWVNSLCPRDCVKLKCMRKKDDGERQRERSLFVLSNHILHSILCPWRISLSKDRENVFFSTFRTYMQLIEAAVRRILLLLVVSLALCQMNRGYVGVRAFPYQVSTMLILNWTNNF